MKIVIDIPEGVHNAILTTYANTDNIDYIMRMAGFLFPAIAHGVPLPIGHGRLVYAEDVKENNRRFIGYLDEDMIERLNIAIDKHVPTIIEADKETKYMEADAIAVQEVLKTLFFGKDASKSEIID